jgi:hypothetical protein
MNLLLTVSNLAASLTERAEAYGGIFVFLAALLMVGITMLVNMRAFYVGLLLVVAAMLLRSREKAKSRGAKADADVKLETVNKSAGSVHFSGTTLAFAMFIGGAVMLVDMIHTAPAATKEVFVPLETAVFNEHTANEALNAEELSILTTYDGPYDRFKLIALRADLALVESKMREQSQDLRWNMVQNRLKAFQKAHSSDPLPTDSEIEEHLKALEAELSEVLSRKALPNESPSPLSPSEKSH